MKKQNTLYMAVGLLAVFILWTAAVRYFDVKAIGPRESAVGFATVNGWFHNLTGVHLSLYILTDWLGLVPVAFGMGFGILGLVQWIRRKHFLKVDFSILILGGFYTVVMAVYLLFEEVVINYRPVLIAGYLEVSYPSSTTLLAMCVMPTAMLQLRRYIRNSLFKGIVTAVLVGFTVFMVIGRLISGVHWLTDIAGGIFLSAGLVLMYRFVCGLRGIKF